VFGAKVEREAGLEGMCVSVRVRILGEDHLIKGDAPAEYIQKLAQYVDTHLWKIHQSNPTLPRHKAAILAALNIADELERLRVEYTELLKLVEEAN
jgi:cell division protein ZapA